MFTLQKALSASRILPGKAFCAKRCFKLNLKPGKAVSAILLPPENAFPQLVLPLIFDFTHEKMFWNLCRKKGFPTRAFSQKLTFKSLKACSTNRLPPENAFPATRVTTYFCIYTSKRAFCHSRTAGKPVFREGPPILS